MVLLKAVAVGFVLVVIVVVLSWAFGKLVKPLEVDEFTWIDDSEAIVKTNWGKFRGFGPFWNDAETGEGASVEMRLKLSARYDVEKWKRDDAKS